MLRTKLEIPLIARQRGNNAQFQSNMIKILDNRSQKHSKSHTLPLLPPLLFTDALPDGLYSLPAQNRVKSRAMCFSNMSVLSGFENPTKLMEIILEGLTFHPEGTVILLLVASCLKPEISKTSFDVFWQSDLLSI